MKRNKIIVMALVGGIGLPTFAQQDTTKINTFRNQKIDIGTNKSFSRSESTSAVSVITKETTDKRSARNIGNSILGQGLGLISLQNSGNYAAANPTMYVRGLQSLSGSSPLVLVDGIERDINHITPEEVESVSVLKDAAAVALYGYRGTNGAILVSTKHGKYNSKSVKVTYDHLINFLSNKPKFVDAATYASALNEARANDGLAPRYTADEITAFRTGQYPDYYPNVNWLEETFRDHGVTNKYNVEFTGGGRNFRYYTMVDLISDKGFVANPNTNEGYSTQNKYVKGNLRANLDIDLTPTTGVRVNVLGVLNEASRPGASANLWDLVYSLPSAAYPVVSENGLWGGNATWAGTVNPAAQAAGAGYTKNHTRAIYTDLTIDQRLDSWIEGLSATVRASYDNASNILENHSKTYVYGSAIPGTWENGAPTLASNYTGGANSGLSSGASLNTYTRQFHFDAGVNYENNFGKHGIYSQLKWDYNFNDENAVNSSLYRQNFSFYTHYGYNKRYYADLALVLSGANRLAPGTKWAFSPTLSAAWVVSNESFMENVSWVNFLKLRASAGLINADNLPDNSWTYFSQQYSMTGVLYPFNSGWGSSFGRTSIGRLATDNPSHEKAYKYNVGLESTILNGLDVTLEGYFQHRTDIWVASTGKYTAVIGLDAPFENAGVVNSWGFEAGLDYNKKFGAVDFNIGGNLNWNRNKIVEQLEEPRLYENLKRTGGSLNQIYGLKAIGFFKDEADIANSYRQTYSTVKPGDIKYEDINGDKVIDANDQMAIGYSNAAPRLYYSLHIGAEWKGLGVYALFQGVGGYSGVMNTKSMYWPLINNTTISEYAYENRWTPEHMDAQFPRLSSQSNTNNYQTSTLWLVNRNFFKLRNLDVYYNLPKSILQPVKIVNAAKLYVRATDLFSIDHMDVSDPESYGATNPLTKSLVLGLSVTF